MNNYQLHTIPCSPKKPNGSQSQRTGFSHSWWRSSVRGYLLAVLFVAVATLISLFAKAFETTFGIEAHFLASPFTPVTLLVGWFWGIGPALLALVLGLLVLDYWIIPPLGVLTFFLWPDMVSFVGLCLVQIVFLGMVLIQKNYRQKLLLANQAVSHYAEELAASNQALLESNTQLEQAHRAKDQFLSMASHELRTPVTSIHGYMQLLLRRLRKQSTQNPDLLPVCDSLSKVDEQTRRLTDLVNDLLDINSLRSGKMPVRLAPCDLRCLCREVVEEQQALTGRSIDLRLAADPVVMQADEARLSQVVSNLVSNALKYSSESTAIRVEVSQKPGEAILAVHNEGPVLSKAQQETIFEPFYRTPDAQSSAKLGWGLGLAISKEIVEQHGGRLWVESLEEKGTTFFVALPLPTS